MKHIILTLVNVLIFSFNYAQYNDAPYRLFGEISTVENETFRGFITWGGVKNYWIDFFEASKIVNPYSHYFHPDNGVLFYNNGRMLATPPTHVFCCRFGNIAGLRPTNDNEILLQLKNGVEIKLIKGASADIGQKVSIATSSEEKEIAWDHISEVRFMSADSNFKAPAIPQIAGIVKSPQGIYKGLITWNYTPQMSREKNVKANRFLSKMKKVTFPKRSLVLMATEKYPKTSFYTNSDILSPMKNVMVNMPNVGSVIVPDSHFIELEVIPLSQLSLLTYEDFKAPKALQGTVITRKKDKIQGTLAYDLDEDLDIEILDGKNNNITYRIPFKFIKSIEPKNYKFSLITLQNNSQLSLGEGPDVNRENSGIMVLGDDIPYYIPWEEVKCVIFQ